MCSEWNRIGFQRSAQDGTPLVNVDTRQEGPKPGGIAWKKDLNKLGQDGYGPLIIPSSTEPLDAKGTTTSFKLSRSSYISF